MANGEGRKTEVALEPGRLLRLRDASGRGLSVTRGAVWITQDGDRRDHMVKSGERFVFDRDGLALVLSVFGATSVLLDDGLSPEGEAAMAPDGLSQTLLLSRLPQFEREARQARAQAMVEAFAAASTGMTRIFNHLLQILHNGLSPSPCGESRRKAA